jgi:DNA polymerase-3 subunit alpha
MGITVLPPDVNASDWSFTPDGGAIRFGLGAVKNLGPSAVESIIQARAQVGRLHSLYQFCEHVDLGAINRRMIESLIRAGAMDSLDGTRAQLFAVVEAAMEAGQRAWRDREHGQAGLFGDFLAAEEKHEKPLPDVPDWPDKDKLAGEKEMLGFYVTGNPLDRYEDKIAELASHNTGNLEGLARGTEVAICGMLTGIQRKRNKEQKAWAALRIEDRNGAVDAMVFAASFERLAPFVVEDQASLIRGLVLPEESGPPRISIQDIIPLDNARIDVPSLISIRVWLGRNGGTDKAAALYELFARKPGPTQVRLRLDLPRNFSVFLDVPQRVKPDREFRAEVAKLCGPDAIEKLAG